jgi:hypothetical protein
MNHEHDSHEHLPEIKDLFHRAGELAVLHGHINDIDNEQETLRQFILDKFPQDIKQQWPELREIIYTPSYMVEYAPSGDMLSFILADADVRSVYTLERNEFDEYDIEVDHAAAEDTSGPYITQQARKEMNTVIEGVFGDGLLMTEAERNRAEHIDFLLTQDVTPGLEDIIKLNEIVTALATQYPR